MKKFPLSLLLMVGLFATVFISCSDDDDTPPLLDPEITGLSPGEGPVGTAVTITGINFGESPVVRFGGTEAEVTSPSPTSITTAVPEGVAAGVVQVTVNNDGEVSDGFDFTVTEADTTDGGGEGEEDGIATAGDTLSDIADLSTLAAAVDAAGLTDALNEADQVTIFAPNNAAFTELLTAFELEDGDLDGLIEALTTEGVAGVLQAHVVADSLGVAEAIEAATAEDSLETLNSSAQILITQEGEDLFVNGAQILTPNIIVGNGVIHVIDSVINTDAAGGETPEEDDVIVPDQSQVADDDAARDVALELIDNFNAVQDVGVSLTNPIPNANLEFVNSQLAAYPDGDFFDEVGYKGAFDPSGANWLDGWSLLSRGGYLGGTASDNAAAYSEDEIMDDDGDDDDGDGENDGNLVEISGTLDATDGITWSADNIYRISGYTFVENGELMIEAGTRVIAETDEISALIITRTATINAQGTVENPIIMTSENDTGDLDENSTGEWGGLIILGSARVNEEGNNELQIEGVPTEIPALYGQADGNFDNERSSGTLRYVSIRYTGAEINPGNELQGLTLGAVGSGTIIEYVESFASSDDGIEIFGGSPNIKYFAVGFAEDDSYDFDLGFNGNIQYGFALQGQNADNLIEWDGADDDNNDVFSDPTLYNMTMISTGVADQALVLRDNTAGVLANSIIFADNTRGIVVENLPDTEDDSYQRLVNGEVELLNNLWFLGDTFTQFNSTESGLVQTVVPD